MSFDDLWEAVGARPSLPSIYAMANSEGHGYFLRVSVRVERNAVYMCAGGLSSSLSGSWEHLSASNIRKEAIHTLSTPNATETTPPAVESPTNGWDSLNSTPFLPKALGSDADSSEVGLALSSATTSFADGADGDNRDDGDTRHATKQQWFSISHLFFSRPTNLALAQVFSCPRHPPHGRIWFRKFRWRGVGDGD